MLRLLKRAEVVAPEVVRGRLWRRRSRAARCVRPGDAGDLGGAPTAFPGDQPVPRVGVERAAGVLGARGDVVDHHRARLRCAAEGREGRRGSRRRRGLHRAQVRSWPGGCGTIIDARPGCSRLRSLSRRWRVCGSGTWLVLSVSDGVRRKPGLGACPARVARDMRGRRSTHELAQSRTYGRLNRSAGLTKNPNGCRVQVPFVGHGCGTRPSKGLGAVAGVYP